MIQKKKKEKQQNYRNSTQVFRRGTNSFQTYYALSSFDEYRSGKKVKDNLLKREK